MISAREAGCNQDPVLPDDPIPAGSRPRARLPEGAAATRHRRRRWPAGALAGEDVFVFLLGARWISLLPPLAGLIWPTYVDATSRLAAPLVLMMALGSNLLLSAFHPRLNRLLQRQPWLLGFDLALGLICITLTGGNHSPYSFYALTPLLAAGYFFQLRGGLAAAATFMPLYVAAILASARITGNAPDMIEALTRLLGVFLTALTFAYLSLLLERTQRTTAELQYTQDELARAETLAAIGKMMGYLSHEVRNPLATIGGYAHQIQRKAADAATVQRHAQVIIDEAARLEELLTDMLDLSRPACPQPQPVDVHQLLDRALLLAGTELHPAPPIKIQKDYDKKLPPVMGNPASLLRAVLNIIRNAMQLMPDGGTLSIATAPRDHGVEIVIKDTGPGIPADVLPTIFTPFVTHRPLGTGLGLAVTHQVIEEHGGTVTAQSEPGRGARFIIHLPVDRTRGE